jgi:hypothetical protein
VVTFQPKAWMAESISTDIFNRQMLPYLQKWTINDYVMAVDGLTCQRKRNYMQLFAASGGHLIVGPPNRTEVWQPVDAGHVGAVLKMLFRQQWTLWTDSAANWQEWESGKMPASRKRVLCTHWWGQAWDIMVNAYAHTIQSAFMITGMLSTVDPSPNDSRVRCDLDRTVAVHIDNVWEDEYYSKCADTWHKDYEFCETKKAKAAAANSSDDDEEDGTDSSSQKTSDSGSPAYAPTSPAQSLVGSDHDVSFGDLFDDMSDADEKKKKDVDMPESEFVPLISLLPESLESSPDSPAKSKSNSSSSSSSSGSD